MAQFRFAAAAGVIGTALLLGGCSSLQQEDTALSPEGEVEVTTSETPAFQPEDTEDQVVTTNLDDPVKDEGLGVTWHMQGVYSDSWSGTVVTFLMRNDNDLPFPPEGLADPKLEISDGTGGYTEVELLPYDEANNFDVLPPGLDLPLGPGASTNLQYRFNTGVGSLWNARLTMGNVVWEGNLNI